MQNTKIMDKGFLNDFGRKVAIYAHVHGKLMEEEQRIAIWNRRCEFCWKWWIRLSVFTLYVIGCLLILIHWPLFVLLIQNLLQVFEFITGFSNVFDPFYVQGKTPFRFRNFTKFFWTNIIKTVENTKCNSYFCMYYYWLALTFG